MNKKLLIGLIVLVIVFIGIRMSQDPQVATQNTDNSDAMSTELSSLDTLDLEADLKSMDADLNAL